MLEEIRLLVLECVGNETHYFDTEVHHIDEVLGLMVLWGIMVSGNRVYVENDEEQWIPLHGEELFLPAILQKMLAYKQWLISFAFN